MCDVSWIPLNALLRVSLPLTHWSFYWQVIPIHYDPSSSTWAVPPTIACTRQDKSPVHIHGPDEQRGKRAGFGKALCRTNIDILPHIQGIIDEPILPSRISPLMSVHEKIHDACLPSPPHLSPTSFTPLRLALFPPKFDAQHYIQEAGLWVVYVTSIDVGGSVSTIEVWSWRLRVWRMIYCHMFLGSYWMNHH